MQPAQWPELIHSRNRAAARRAPDQRRSTTPLVQYLGFYTFVFSHFQPLSGLSGHRHSLSSTASVTHRANMNLIDIVFYLAAAFCFSLTIPVAVTGILTCRNIHRGKDPARRGFTWVKGAYVFMVLSVASSFVCRVEQGDHGQLTDFQDLLYFGRRLLACRPKNGLHHIY